MPGVLVQAVLLLVLGALVEVVLLVLALVLAVVVLKSAQRAAVSAPQYWLACFLTTPPCCYSHCHKAVSTQRFSSAVIWGV